MNNYLQPLSNTTLLVIAAASMTSYAIAHTGIQSSSPSDKQIIEIAPKQLQLIFKRPVRLMKLALKDGDDQAMKIGFKPKSHLNKSYNIALPEMTEGQYTVAWLIMGKDGHKIKGDFNFTIQSTDSSNDQSN